MTAPPLPDLSAYLDPAHAASLNARNVAVRTAPDGKGRGVFAVRAILPGEIVLSTTILQDGAERTIYTIQWGEARHITVDEPGVLLNHSCAPNVAVAQNRFGSVDFVALRVIAPDDEICFDYASTERTMIAPEVCLCGTPECRGRPGGFDTLPADHPLRNPRLVAPYIAATL